VHAADLDVPLEVPSHRYYLSAGDGLKGKNAVSNFREYHKLKFKKKSKFKQKSHIFTTRAIFFEYKYLCETVEISYSTHISCESEIFPKT
jgi:hypothetical protein